MPEGLRVGGNVLAGKKVEAKVGNCLPLRNIPVGFTIHNVEITPSLVVNLLVAAGTSVQLVAKGIHMPH